VYIAVSLALVIAVLGVVGVVRVEIIQAATLATLSVFAVSVLVNRIQVAELESGTKALADVVKETLQGRVSVDQFLTTRLIGLEDALSDATDIRLSGVTLTRFLLDHRAELRVRLDQGANVRAIIIDPHGSGVEQAGLRCVEASTNYYEPRLASAIGMLGELADKTSRGFLELRGVPYLPAFSLTIVDPEKPGGRIYVEQYHHRTSAPHPTLCLQYERDKNGSFYHFFLDQFEVLWQSARPIELTGPRMSTQ
jgi:hypothetical protein